MKHLKLFNDAASYEAWKNSEECVLPNVSYTDDGNLYYNAYVAPVSPNLVLTFDVTDVSQETKVMHDYAGGAFTSMIVDGVETEFDYYYQFNTIGEHTVEFVYAEGYNNKIGEGWLRVSTWNGSESISPLIKIEIPATVTYVDNNNTIDAPNVREIVFHSMIAPTDHSLSWYDGMHIADNGVLKYPKGADYSEWIAHMNQFHPNWVCIEF